MEWFFDNMFRKNYLTAEDAVDIGEAFIDNDSGKDFDIWVYEIYRFCILYPPPFS